MSNEGPFIDGFITATILIASLHGLLLAIILLLYKRLKSKSNRYLAFAILAASVVLSLEIVYYFDIEDRLPIIIQYLPIYWRTAIPVFILYFILYLINPEHQLRSFEKLGVGFIALEIFLEILYIPVNIFSVDDSMIEYLEQILVAAEGLVGIVTCFLFFGLAMQKVKNYQKYLYNNYSTTQDKSLGWLIPFLWMNIGITILWFMSYLIGWFGYGAAAEVSYIAVIIGLGLLLYCIGYNLVLRYDWFYVVPIEIEYVDESQKNKLSSKTNLYYQNLIRLMQDEKLYTDVELTLQKVSEQLGISSGYLSRIINEKEHKNFFEFVNAYRVQEVKRKLVDKEYLHYSIFGIALESGFKSKSTFNTVFKRMTGYTPSGYQKQTI